MYIVFVALNNACCGRHLRTCPNQVILINGKLGLLYRNEQWKPDFTFYTTTLLRHFWNTLYKKCFSTTTLLIHFWYTLYQKCSALWVHFWYTLYPKCTKSVQHFWYTFGTLLTFSIQKCTKSVQHLWYTFGTLLTFSIQKCTKSVQHFWYTFGTLFDIFFVSCKKNKEKPTFLLDYKQTRAKSVPKVYQNC